MDSPNLFLYPMHPMFRHHASYQIIIIPFVAQLFSLMVPLFSSWPLYDPFAFISLHKDVLFFKCMWRIPSCMEICRKKSTWSNLLILLKILPLFIDNRGHSMVLNKLIGLGMRIWISYFSRLNLFIVLLTL